MSVYIMRAAATSRPARPEGLGTMRGRQNASLFPARAGFASVRVERFDADVLNAYFYATKGTLS